MINEADIPRYAEHEGTIRIAGTTLPDRAGRCAFYLLQSSKLPIEFLSIGGNSNQQATKAMGVFRYMVENSPEFKGMAVAFQPYLYLTTADGKDKFVTVWRTVIFEPKKE